VRQVASMLQQASIVTCVVLGNPYRIVHQGMGELWLGTSPAITTFE
jgi:hypothetical protein